MDPQANSAPTERNRPHKNRNGNQHKPSEFPRRQYVEAVQATVIKQWDFLNMPQKVVQQLTWMQKMQV